MRKTILSIALVVMAILTTVAQQPQGNQLPQSNPQRQAPRIYQYETVENIKYRQPSDPAYLKIGRASCRERV